MDIEREVALMLKERVGVPVVLEVPRDRPDEFVSVELLGGGSGMFDQARLAVQSWARTRLRARQIASEVERAAADLDEHPNLFGPSVDDTYRFPDPDSGQARYQTVVSIWVCE